MLVENTGLECQQTPRGLNRFPMVQATQSLDRHPMLSSWWAGIIIGYGAPFGTSNVV